MLLSFVGVIVGPDRWPLLRMLTPPFWAILFVIVAAVGIAVGFAAGGGGEDVTELVEDDMEALRLILFAAAALAS